MGTETTARPVRNKESVALILIGLIWLAHVIMNWFWLSSNVTILGWDRTAHLVRSLDYLDLLQPFSIEGLFNALTQPSFYPPLFHIASAGFYTLFGVSADSASLTKSIFLAILLFSVYGIGKQLYNVATGLLAACLVSLFPIVFFMSRYTYIDFTMMSFVALSIFLLLKSNRFQVRGWSYALGASLGLGLLAKWVFVAFVGPPCLYVFLTSPVTHDLKGVLTSRHARWRRLGMAVVIGLGGASLWYLASGNWDTKATFGVPLALLYWVLLTILIYVGSLPARAFNNFVGTTVIALGTAAIWYIPNNAFITTALYKAYYVGSETKGLWSPIGLGGGWIYYIRGTVNEHLSAPIVLSFLILVVAWLVTKWRRRELWPLSDRVWILGLWIIVPFAFFASFSNSGSWSMRFTISLLPPVAIILAIACLRIKVNWVRILTIAIILTIGFAQWLVLSLDTFAWLPERTVAQLPKWGEINWFAQGEFVQWPDYGLTDHRYWVMPSILEHVTRRHDSTSLQPSTVGLLVNQPYLNGYSATYLARTEYPDIEVIDLFRNRNGIPVYPRLFSMDYVVLSDSGIKDVKDRDQSTSAVTAILTQPPEAFRQAFDEIATFQTPNQDVIHLYRNETYDPPSFVSADLMPDSPDNAANINFGEQLLLMNYRIDEGKLAQTGKLDVVLYWLGLREMEEDYLITLKLVNSLYQVWGQQQGRPAWNSFPTSKWQKGQVVVDEREIPILPGTPPGSYEIEVVIRGLHEELELSPVRGQGASLGPVEVPLQSHLSPQQLDIDNPLRKDLGDKVRFLGYNVESGFRPGDNIHLTLFWQALQDMDTSYTVFCHLIGPDGRIRGQKDMLPAAGSIRLIPGSTRSSSGINATF